MNRIYRLVWSAVREIYIPAAENARGQGKRASRPRVTATLTAATLALGSVCAQAGGPAAGLSSGPAGGVITAGSGSIAQSGALTTITQASPRLSLTWNSFNIPAHDIVDFIQPSASALAVNRILDVNGTQILGELNANGQVYLINPNGIVFGPGAEVNVGGLVASTLALDDATLPADAQSFSGDSAGSIINHGTIHAADGGYVAVLARHVDNSGVISAQLGTVALGAGSAATLRFRGTHLVSMQVDQSVLASVVDNGGLLRADGGQVLMTAGAQKALMASVVNNTGVIEARTLDHHDGTITLRGGTVDGTVTVAGTLDASAPDGGNGGAIETSAVQVQIANDASVTTAAAHGLTGSWLIDPTDFTISAGTSSRSASGIGASTLQTELSGSNVSIATSASGSQNGDIDVDAPLSWSSNMLTLTAANNINVNAVMTLSGTAKANFEPGASGTLLMGFATDGSFAGRVDISSSAANALTIGGQIYTVINSLGTAADATTGNAQTLQGMARAGNLAGNFALGSNIDASATGTASDANYFGSAGFAPIGTRYANFSGSFDGLGHTIDDLTINRATIALANEGVGLFGYGAMTASIRNVGIVGGLITVYEHGGGLIGTDYGSISNCYTDVVVDAGLAQSDFVGGLVGVNYGTLSGSHAAGNVSANVIVGGLAGSNPGTISSSYATGTVTAVNPAVQVNPVAGGLVGVNYGTVSRSYATGAVQSINGGYSGGLVGRNVANTNYGQPGIIVDSHATGAVTGTVVLGGLVGANYGPISSSYAIGTVTGASYVGGLVGKNFPGSAITASFASGAVAGSGNLQRDSGGLAGYNDGAVSASYATGAVSGNYNEGGLVGYNDAAGAITGSHSSSAVTGTTQVGGLAGANYGSVATSHASGLVNGTSVVGGLVGNNDGNGTATISLSYAIGNVSGDGQVGGLVGMNTGTIILDFASGNVTPASNSSGGAGGLVGLNFGSINNSYATGSVNGFMNVGGLVGTNYGSVSNAYATGAVSGVNGLGGLVGSNYGSVSNSFYSSSANPTLAGGLGVGSADSPGTVMGLSTASLQMQATFTSATTANGNANPAWDFGSTWMLYEGHTAPLLQAFMTPLTVSGTVTQRYNGAVFAPTISNLSYSIVPDESQLFGTVTVAGTAVAALHPGTYSFTPGGLYSDQLGYLIEGYVGGTLTIDPARLTVAGSTASKVYDGTTVAPLAGGTLLGVFAGDSVTLAQAGTFASKNAGAGIAVAVTDSIGGASDADYVLVEPLGVTGTITPAPLSVNGTIVGNKIYNGTTSVSLLDGTLSGVLPGDSVTLIQAGNFASAGVGSGIAVTAADSLAGPSALDYSLIQPIGLRGTISPASAGNAPGAALLAADNASAQIDANSFAPQWGATPQVIDASPTIEVLESASEPATTDAGVDQDSSSSAGQGVVINVAMQIGATGNLKIVNGGLRLPVTHTEASP